MIDAVCALTGYASPVGRMLGHDLYQQVLDLGLHALAHLAHSMALTRAHLAVGAATVVHREPSSGETPGGSRTTAMAAQTLGDEIVTRPPGRWGRYPVQDRGRHPPSGGGRSSSSSSANLQW